MDGCTFFCANVCGTAYRITSKRTASAGKSKKETSVAKCKDVTVAVGFIFSAPDFPKDLFTFRLSNFGV